MFRSALKLSIQPKRKLLLFKPLLTRSLFIKPSLKSKTNLTRPMQKQQSRRSVSILNEMKQEIKHNIKHNKIEFILGLPFYIVFGMWLILTWGYGTAFCILMIYVAIDFIWKFIKEIIGK